MKFTVILLFIVTFAISASGQSIKICYSKIYNFADTLPVLISSPKELLEIFKREIEVPVNLREQKGSLNMTYAINCHGETANLRVPKFADSDGNLMLNAFDVMADQVAPILRRELKWKPAWHAGKNVDFYMFFSITFDRGIVVSIQLNEH